jgi:Flp pilus assembly pilin Flp
MVSAHRSLEESHMKNLIARFVREEKGQDLIEYALVATFVSLAAVAGATILGGELDTWYTDMGAAIPDVP